MYLANLLCRHTAASRCFAVLLLALAPYSFASDPFGNSNDDEFLPVEQAYQVIVQTHDNNITMDWTIAEGYYLYQHQFELIAQTRESKETLPLTYQPGERKYDEYFEKELETYHHNTQVIGKLPSTSPPYELVVTSQGCADAGLCYPPRKQYFSVEDDGIVLELSESQLAHSPATTRLNPAENSAVAIAPAVNASTPTPEPQSIGLVLLSAILGGLILNLMPCVFPVLSLKALSMASSGSSPQKQHMHGWAYTAGVVGSFLVAAAAILITREAGAALGWGFQLQEPIFVALMAYLFFVMALTLSGMFNIGTSLMGAGQNLTQGHGLKSSFFTGVLAALVASPCTAPFMATALGVAITQPAPIALLIFAALGFGMALPFILLSYLPSLASKLPAPGPWMETLKEFLAFPLYVTCVWLLWVFGNQSSGDGAALLVLGGTLIAFGIWLNNQSPNLPTIKFGLKILSIICIVGAIALAFRASQFRSTTSESNDQWVPYSAAALQTLREQKQAVFVDFTADWCITCKVNEQIALSSDAFYNFATENNITLMKGDWTNANPEITTILNQHGRSGVPLYLVYSSDNSREVQVLPQILSPNIVMESMKAAIE